MGSEYFINNQELEDKIRQLLPSQGGAGAGFDLSASTQIIPIIDLTESAEGSSLRQDLQKSFSHDNLTFTKIVNATRTTIINNTGYWLLKGSMSYYSQNLQGTNFELYDGATYKKLYEPVAFEYTAVGGIEAINFEYMIKLGSGDSLVASTPGVKSIINVASRQIATISDELVNP